MRFTNEEFETFLANNPHLSVQGGIVRRVTPAQQAIAAAQQSFAPAPWPGEKPAAGTGAIKGQRKRKKYGNMRVAVLADGSAVFESVCTETGQPFPKSDEAEMVFASEKEYFRWEELKALQSAGVISELDTQKCLEIQPAAILPSGEKLKAVQYRADFFYKRLDGVYVVEDVKARSSRTGEVITTQVFTLKWKLLKVKYPDYLFRIEA